MRTLFVGGRQYFTCGTWNGNGKLEAIEYLFSGWFHFYKALNVICITQDRHVIIKWYQYSTFI